MGTLEAVPAGVNSTGNVLILFVPTIAIPGAPTVAELTASGVKKLTYSLTGDGYSHNVTEGTVTKNRFTLAQVLQSSGDVTDDLEITYVYDNTTGDVVRLALPAGQTGFIVERWAVPNDTDVAAAQKVDVIPISAGLQRKAAPARNEDLTRVQKLNVTGRVFRDVAIAA